MNIQAALKKHFRPLIAPLNRVDVLALGQVLQPCAFEPGAVVVREGEPLQSIYLLTDGRLLVRVERDGAAEEIGRLERGALFGEVSFLDELTASATITALTDARALRLDRQGLDRLRADRPEAAAHVWNTLCRILAERVRAAEQAIEDRSRPEALAAPDGHERLSDIIATLLGIRRRASPLAEALSTLPGFQALSSEERQILEHALWTQAVPSGHRFIQQGRRSDTAYLILEGEIQISRCGGGRVRQLARLGPGELFGVLALVDPKPRAATCVAVGPVRVACIQREVYARLQRDPRLSRPLEQLVVGQLTRDFRRVQSDLADVGAPARAASA